MDYTNLVTTSGIRGSMANRHAEKNLTRVQGHPSYRPDKVWYTDRLTNMSKAIYPDVVEGGINIVGVFSPFPTIFSTLSNTNFNFSVTFILSSANAFNLDKSKILLSGKGLKSNYLVLPQMLLKYIHSLCLQPNFPRPHHLIEFCFRSSNAKCLCFFLLYIP